MEETRDIKNVINIACKLTSAVEGFNNNNKQQLLSTQFKVLYEVYKKPHINASMLANNLNMAKSNLALCCKKFCTSNLLISTKDSFDKRSVFYDLTSQGKSYVEQMLISFNNNFEKEFGEKNKEFYKAICKLSSLI